MPTLKELLNAFGKASARNTLPRVPVNTIDYNVPISQTEYSLTASEDGWLSIYTYGGTLDVYAGTAVAIGHSKLNFCGMMLPVIKGQTITMDQTNNTHIIVRVFRAIGTA